MTLLLTAFLLACSENSLANKDEDAADADTGFEAGTLRLDITPPAGLASPELLPQTLLTLPNRYTGLVVELRPTVTVSGTLLAEVAHPLAAASVPTEVVPLVGVVAVGIDNSLQLGKTTTDEDGTFSLAMVADGGYSLTVVPDDASASPLVALSDIDLSGDLDLSRTLPTGIPVYGRVTNADGTPLPGVPLRIRPAGTANQTPSAVTLTDATGWYTLRVAEPGDYAVEVVGGPTDNDDVVPGLVREVSVPDAEGTSLYLDVGVLTHTTVAGTVRDAGRERAEDTLVRIRSTSLADSDGVLELETSTDERGEFTANVLPGTYDITFIPPYEPVPSSGPLTVHLTLPSGETDIDEQVLPGIGRLSGRVSGADGEDAIGAQVVVEQVVSGYHYDAVTDQHGTYSLDLPIASYRVTVWPAPGTTGAVTEVMRSPGESGEVVLKQGEPVTGVLSWSDVPVPYAYIEVVDPRTGRRLGTATTDDKGVFAVEVVVPDEADGDTGDGSDTTPSDTGDGSDTATSDTGLTATDTGHTDTGGTDTATGETGATDTGGADTGDSAGDTASADTGARFR